MRRVASRALAAVVAVAALSFSTELRARAQDVASCTSSIRVLMNHYGDAQIAAGATVWFSSVLQDLESAQNDLATTPIRIDVRHSQITFGTWPHTIALPDSTVYVDPAATQPQRWWVDRSAWSITLAPSQVPEAFFDGMPFTVPEPFIPGDSGPVTWTATFTASRAGITLRWAWSAAVYSQFGTNGQLLVKPLSAPVGQPQPALYQNDDPAGTPERYKQDVIAGAMGSGAPQYTGARSESATVQPCVSAAPPPLSSPAQPVRLPALTLRRIYVLNALPEVPTFSTSVSQRRTFGDGSVGEAAAACDTGDLCALIRYRNGDRLAMYSEGAASCHPYALYFKRTNGSRTLYAFSRSLDHDTQPSPCGRTRTTHITMDGGRIHLTILQNSDGSLKFRFD